MRALTIVMAAILGVTLVAGLLYDPLWLYVAFALSMVMMHLGGHGSHGHGSSQHPHTSRWMASAGAVAPARRGSETDGLGITVTPLSLSNDNMVELGISAGSAQGDIGPDVMRTAQLSDSNGMNYSPVAWNGYPPRRDGGGVLSFPSLEGRPSSVRLVLRGFRGADRTFTWSLGS